LKGKDALASGFDMPTLVSWMQRWVADLVSVRLGGPVRFFPDREGVLRDLAGRLTVDAALGCYNEITVAPGRAAPAQRPVISGRHAIAVRPEPSGDRVGGT
jgi:hypothetical protein